jgi:hypothetical protein
MFIRDRGQGSSVTESVQEGETRRGKKNRLAVGNWAQRAKRI